MEWARRRILWMIGRVRIRAGDDSGDAQQLQMQLNALEVRDNTPRIAEFGFSSMPPVGSDAVVVFIGGERSEAIIIATNHQPSRPRNLAAGEAIVYDNFGQYVRLTPNGIVVHSPISIRFEAPVIDLHASTTFKFDVNGQGQKWDGSGVETWQDNDVAKPHHNHAPPEIP
ncbi:MAG TPA: phage baseplate assembly protein V [Pyrinomonadaceae bacterium]|nr:phage baseplate assembly protein V [Pyrinomonadaceae bacterium]